MHGGRCERANRSLHADPVSRCDARPEAGGPGTAGAARPCCTTPSAAPGPAVILCAVSSGATDGQRASPAGQLLRPTSAQDMT
jgi:hypothetical protein